jgi:hypothetical protein
MEERNYSVGTHTIAFNTESYVPGIYSVRVNVEGHVLTKKLVVLK